MYFTENIQKNLKTNLIFSFIICYLFTMLSVVYWEVNFFSIFVPMTLSSVAWAFFFSKFTTKKNQSILIISLFFILAVMVYEVKNHSIPLLGLDWKGYSYRAEYNLTSGKHGIGLLFTQITDDLYAKLISITYDAFGVCPESVHCYTLFISFCLNNVFYDVVFSLFKDKEKADKYSIIMSIIPIYLLHSIAFLREVPIAFLLLSSFFYICRFYETQSYFAYALSLLLSTCAAIMHGGVIVVPLAYIVSLIFYSFQSKKVVLKPSKIIIVAVLFLAFFMLPINDVIMAKFGNEDVLKTIDNHITTDATTSYISEAPSNYGLLLIQTPLRFALFELAPLPWHIRGFSTAIAWLLDGIFRMIILYYEVKAIANFKKVDNQRKIILLILILIWLFFGVLCGWGTSTYGTAMRHRIKILPLEIILISFYFENKNNASNRSI